MLIFNPKNFKNIFQSNSENNEDEIPNIDKIQILKQFQVNKKDNILDNKNLDLGETNMSKEKKLGSIIDNAVSSIKVALGITSENEELTENVEVQDEQNQEVSEVVETVAEETEAQEEIVEPSAEVTEEIEPSTETEPVATEESDVANEDVAGVEEQPVQEEPETEVAPEVTEEHVQNESDIEPKLELAEEEIEPSTEASVSTSEINAGSDLAKELAKVKEELNKIKEADAQKAIALAKAELAKEVGNKFKGVPGKLEDKVELVYELKNSALSDSSKEMIFKSLENLSAQNLEACEEFGHSEEVIVDESDKMSQAKALAQKEGISEGQAILVLDGTKTLKQVKNKK